ncbi:hypothetical protein HK100_012051, partial [Physocladia obscura]
MLVRFSHFYWRIHEYTFTGWGVDSILEASVVLQLRPGIERLRRVKVQCEFRGYTETRWEASAIGRLALYPESSEYRVSKTARIFHNIVQTVYDSVHPLVPSSPGATIS